MSERIDQVGGFEWGMACCCFVMGTILRSAFIIYTTGNESWMVGIFGAIAFMPMAAGYLSLLRRYPGMNLFEIVSAVLGGAVGTVVNILFVLFYIAVACLNMMEIGSFITGYLIRGSNFLLVTVVTGAAVAYALRKGMSALMRTIPLVAIIGIALVIFSSIQSIPESNFRNLMPWFVHTPGEFVHGTLIAIAIPYGEMLTMFALVPHVRPGTSLKKPMFLSIAFTMVIMVVVHVREAITLGALLTYTVLPSFDVYRMIDTASSFVRTESINAMILVALTYIKVTFLIYAAAQGLAHIGRLKSAKPLSIITCMFIAVYAEAFHNTSYNNIEWSVNVTPLIWITFEYAIPAALLLCAWFKSRVVRKAVTL
jgi:spore germination protein KB